MDPAPETRVDLEGDPPLIDDQFEEDVLEPPLREDRDAELPRRPDVDEPLTAEQGQPDVRGGATTGEPDVVHHELKAQAMDYGRCADAAVAVA
jgi:hypothetical protein